LQSLILPSTLSFAPIVPNSFVEAEFDTKSHFEKISKLCKEEWPKNCYTKIPMLDFLIRLINGQNVGRFTQRSPFKDKKGLEEKILMSSEGDLKPLWQEGHGLCPSWCISISDKAFGPYTIGGQVSLNPVLETIIICRLYG
jgi:hypothetical protein